MKPTDEQYGRGVIDTVNALPNTGSEVEVLVILGVCLIVGGTLGLLIRKYAL